ncbi:hypothetical protein [Leptolyngbya iicbica]|uniref:Uncharacterized protein n=2 Tax=Cyanophyceae TaxID=3028117 RepID=A0A4Q7E6D2_9CYAN|nr:hypothetical protein [Leptolyngbya sp. LK]RZM77788.1 hypothetical protein DYY88_14530 [Leptolyngbya sp. LK]
MAHLPDLPEDADENVSVDQSFTVEKSDISHSILPGQAGKDFNQVAGNKVERDLNQFIYNLGTLETSSSNWQQLRVSLEKASIEKAQFEESLNHARELIRRARARLNELLEIVDTRKDKKEILQLVHEIQDFLSEEETLEDIIRDGVYDAEAASWLFSNLERLKISATAAIFSSKVLPAFRSEQESQLSLEVLQARFMKTIETYIGWISIHIDAGTDALEIDRPLRSQIHLDFVNQAYIDAFTYVLCNEVNPNKVQLSLEAAKSIHSYFNQFLMCRNFERDI